MTQRIRIAAIAASALIAGSPLAPTAAAQEKIVRVDLAYHAPVVGQPKPNFSPKGMQVPLVDLAANAALPAGAVRPAKTGKMQIGPNDASWMPVPATATVDIRKTCVSCSSTAIATATSPMTAPR